MKKVDLKIMAKRTTHSSTSFLTYNACPKNADQIGFVHQVAAKEEERPQSTRLCSTYVDTIGFA